ncbi:MAG TPA: alpha-ketoglutarate-dependent dioxygenase AlkB [Acidimicrobiia bacterium]
MEDLGRDSDTIVLHRDAVGAQRAADLFTRVLDEVDWKRDEIVMYGRRVAIPRLQAWLGDAGAEYTYSGLRMHPAPWTPAVLELRAVAEQVAGARFNSVLANLYRDGRDSLAWHSDDEPELGSEPVIASVSLGAVRRCRFRRRSDSGDAFGIDLPTGSVLVTGGTTQVHWQHAIPKTAADVGPRINLTYRCIVR